jgi:hypothetical protein
MPLKRKSACECQLDDVPFGERMIRLIPPGRERIEFAPYFDAWAGGGEDNVSYALSRMGLRTRMTVKRFMTAAKRFSATCPAL